MKKLFAYSILFSLVIFNCDFPTESESWIEEKYPFCIIDSNGKNLKILKEEGWNGGSLYFISNDKEIIILSSDSFYLLDKETGDEEFIYRIPLRDIRDKKLSPDRTFLIFIATNDEGRDLYSVNIDGSNLHRLTYSPTEYKRYPSFSHDGQKIVYSSFYLWSDPNAKEQKITIYSLADSTQKVIISEKNKENVSYTPIHYWYPCFSFDNERILFLKSNEVAGAEDSLFTIKIDGTNKKLIDPNASNFAPLSVSNNSNRLVYLRYGDPFRVASMNDDGSDLIEIDKDVSFYCDYIISDNGKKVLLWDRHTNENLLYIVDSDGLNRIKLASAIRGSFSISGTKIVYTGYNKITHK